MTLCDPALPPLSPQVNPDIQSSYEVLAQKSNVVAVHLANSPGTTTYLYEERPSGYHPDGSHEIAGQSPAHRQSE